MKNFLMKNYDGKNADVILQNAYDNYFRPLFYDESYDNMKTDVKETESTFEMEIDMPGFDKSDISVDFEDGYLNVKAEKKESDEQSDKHNFIRKERCVSCSRSYFVGDVDKDSVKAKYSNGVLSLSVPKEQPVKEKKTGISIE